MSHQTPAGAPAYAVDVRFPWNETAAQLQALASHCDLAVDGRGRTFVGRDRLSDQAVRFVPPTVFPIADLEETPQTYATTLPGRLGHHLVVLLQAGAAALGTFRGGEPLRHKVIKKYVTRGRGRAQPAYLKTSGKSRYGSRLRLQNARRLLDEVNERLTEWLEQDGGYDLLLGSCPTRLWADLQRATVPFPLPKDAFVRIPRDVEVPSHDELTRAYRTCQWGRIERKAPSVG